MYVAKMARFNPWWKDRTAIGRDPKMAALRASALRAAPDPAGMFEAGDYIYSLRGPRQVGKTTLVKMEIGRLLEHVPPRNVMYYSFESEQSPLDVENVINEYFDKSGQSEKSRRYLFLDEISNVIDWQRAVKLLKDMNMLENCTVVTTGSHSVDLAKATELLAGRRGEPRRGMLDRVVMPMNFRKFVMSTDRSCTTTRRGLSRWTRNRACPFLGALRGAIWRLRSRISTSAKTSSTGACTGTCWPAEYRS